MLTATFNMNLFQRGIKGLVLDCGINAKKVVAKEMGELEKTLSRLSPKADPKKIKTDINRRFAVMGSSEHEFDSAGPRRSFEGQGDVRWYAANSRALYGVKADADYRKASVEDLKKLMYARTKGGKIRGKHGRQAVYITQRVLTKASTVARLAAAKVRNRGRLAAGWLVATFRGPIKITGSGQPPKFVTRHAEGARGTFIDSLAVPNFPRFTITNFAKGISGKTINGMIQKALNIRGKAMAANALMFMKGKKKIADYAR